MNIVGSEGIDMTDEHARQKDIELMCNKAHIAHALHSVASRIVNFNDCLAGEVSGQIPDDVGNTVGKWEITETVVN